MNKKLIQIRKSDTADTRTCDWAKVNKDELLRASKQHIGDIRKGFDFFQEMMLHAMIIHDLIRTDITAKIILRGSIQNYYRDFCHR